MTAKEYLAGHWKARRVWEHLAWPKHQERLRECAALVRGEAAADIGCGFGHSTEIMRGFRSEAAWTGVEFDLEAVTLATQNFPGHDFKFVSVGDLLAGLAASAWDSVVCSEVLEHVDKDAEFARAVAGAARRRAIFTTPAKRVNDPGHLRLYSDVDLSNLFSFAPAKVWRSGLFLFVLVCQDPADLVEEHGTR